MRDVLIDHNKGYIGNHGYVRGWITPIFDCSSAGRSHRLPSSGLTDDFPCYYMGKCEGAPTKDIIVWDFSF